MELIEAMRARHSVRKYRNIPIEPTMVTLLEQKIAELNAESGLHMKLFCEEPHAFSGKLAHYGSLETCRNYITIVGEKGRDEDLLWFRASASMPLAARVVDIDGKKYLDGGIADSGGGRKADRSPAYCVGT